MRRNSRRRLESYGDLLIVPGAGNSGARAESADIGTAELGSADMTDLDGSEFDVIDEVRRPGGK